VWAISDLDDARVFDQNASLPWERPPVEFVESVIRSTYNIVNVGGVK